MKVYVDKLPKSCEECPCNSETYYCNALNQDIGLLKYGEIHQDCPLQTLADHDKQVRKQICDEIRLKAVHSQFGYMGKTQKGYYDIYAGILDDIEKGE